MPFAFAIRLIGPPPHSIAVKSEGLLEGEAVKDRVSKKFPAVTVLEQQRGGSPCMKGLVVVVVCVGG